MSLELPTIESADRCTEWPGTTVIVGHTADGVKVSLDPLVSSDGETILSGPNYGSRRPSIDGPRIIDQYMEDLVELDSRVSWRIQRAEVNTAFHSMRRAEGVRSVIEHS